ncbi:hypothetical protein TIFTF001_000482 [Ficus carica]|uniref:Uncharacterized protein n=1 Tax=Ficus carica TaxID=3494 RepID=A0AA87ZGD3_FICCA|nr:hypothetical protein TIFTF001_000482 [Ficus carica]
MNGGKGGTSMAAAVWWMELHRWCNGQTSDDDAPKEQT